MRTVFRATQCTGSIRAMRVARKWTQEKSQDDRTIIQATHGTVTHRRFRRCIERFRPLRCSKNTHRDSFLFIVLYMSHHKYTNLTRISSIWSSREAALISRRAFSFSASSSWWRLSSNSTWYIALICNVSLPHFDFSFSKSSANFRFWASSRRTYASVIVEIQH